MWHAPREYAEPRPFTCLNTINAMESKEINARVRIGRWGADPLHANFFAFERFDQAKNYLGARRIEPFPWRDCKVAASL
jgi:hypothetical protein